MKSNYTKVISLLIIIATIYYSFYSLLPNNFKDDKSDSTKFSIDNAINHLNKIAQKPHYVGTNEHEKVKNYLITALEDLGLQVATQNQIALNRKWRAGVKAKNIIAKIKGTDPNSKALVLLTHYDSAVHSSKGASDAGSGVVTILEGIRAFLASKQTHKNDIIILFTDAEEIGLVGANAFVKHHAWADQVGLVLNFEARGSGGPSYMLLETNGGNKELILAFKKAKPNFPVANSLMYSIYKALPNDTDLTVFREDADINGFNFAFIDDHYDYHTSQDIVQRLDLNTLKQQSDYFMTLVPHFANANLKNLNAKSDLIYFSVPKIGLITYPFSWVLGLFILATILFFGITFLGVQKNKLTTVAMFAGFVPFLASMIIAGLVALFGWKMLKFIYPQYKEILHGFTYNGHLYIVAFVCLTLAILFWFYQRYFRKHSASNLMVAPLFIWGIINLLIAIYLKGAGFFIFPIFLALISLAILLFSKENNKVKLLFITILAIPTLIVFVPLIKMFPVGLGLKMLTVSAVFVVLIFGLLIPLFHQYKNSKKLSYLFLILSGLAFITASLKAEYSKDRKQPTSLVYIIDADKGEAFYASYEAKINDFNKAYLTNQPTSGSFDKGVNASKYATRYKLHKKTNVMPLKQPVINKIYDSIIGNYRQIKLEIINQRNTNRMELLVKDSLNFKEFIVNSENLRTKKDGQFLFHTGKKKNLISYYFTKNDTILKLNFTLPKTEKPSFVLYDTKYDLFTNKYLNVQPRKSDKIMPTPFVINDATIIKKEINF